MVSSNSHVTVVDRRSALLFFLTNNSCVRLLHASPHSCPEVTLLKWKKSLRLRVPRSQNFFFSRLTHCSVCLAKSRPVLSIDWIHSINTALLTYICLKIGQNNRYICRNGKIHWYYNNIANMLKGGYKYLQYSVLCLAFWVQMAFMTLPSMRTQFFLSQWGRSNMLFHVFCITRFTQSKQKAQKSHSKSWHHRGDHN